METVNIKKELSNDNVYNQMNKEFISLKSPDEKVINEHLELILKKLIPAMKTQSTLFNKTYQKLAYTGSYFKKTRVGAPEEFDLNLIINLPLKEKDFEFKTDHLGYTKIRIKKGDTNTTFNLDQKAYKEMNTFIDQDSYLNQNKFRNWIEGILSNVANSKKSQNGKNNQIILDGISYPIYIKRKSGPAFTLSFTPIKKPIDIDLVPVLAFPIRNPPPGFNARHSLNSSRSWYAVPKPLYSSKYGNESHRYWRLSFYELEKDILDEYYTANRIKSTIRHLKKFRDTQNLKSIASYYIETLCLHERNIFVVNSKESFTFLFFTMLQKLRDAFKNKRIDFYWVAGVDLLEKMSDVQKEQIKCRLDNIIKDIERNIKEDKFVIAKYTLPANEFSKLRSQFK
ncbi:cyclic GMP-AMP synthase-like [Pseudomyrmex gracilis]|uniref:cyclic GMP-AMP synthase-like n=1 Tax=Pseudomyrmex gracilis TaxID=219809 RepID=UPI000994A913|nr:cyclic GMP-AMP synthase-like [Pseudomyrmex gracilis]